MKKQPEVDFENLLTGPALARKLQIDPATPRRWIREGCPFHSLGGYKRFDLEEVLTWHAKRRAQKRPARG
jgi:hypothetical protein